MYEQMQMLARMLIGCDPEQRVGIYEDPKHAARQFDHKEHRPNDLFTMANK